jgi:hypothetical protein
LGSPGGTSAAALCERERDEPLLYSIVQIPLDLPPRLVRGRDDPRPRGGERLRSFSGL